MAVDSALQPPCESHASAAHRRKLRPRAVIGQDFRSLIGWCYMCADSCGGTRASHAVLAEHQ